MAKKRKALDRGLIQFESLIGELIDEMYVQYNKRAGST